MNPHAITVHIGDGVAVSRIGDWFVQHPAGRSALEITVADAQQGGTTRMLTRVMMLRHFSSMPTRTTTARCTSTSFTRRSIP